MIKTKRQQSTKTVGPHCALHGELRGGGSSLTGEFNGFAFSKHGKEKLLITITNLGWIIFSGVIT